MRHQKTQLILIGTIIFLHQQIEVYINLRRLWLSPRALFWPTLIPIGIWCIGEMVKIKKRVDAEDDPELAILYNCVQFLELEEDTVLP